MAKVRLDDSDDPIDICYDNVFKAVFTKPVPESQGALSRLVSALIGRDVTVITITANEPPIDNIRDRQIRFDINCRSDSGELINVEMSLNPDPFEPVRLEFHAGKLFTGQDIRGKDEYGDEKTFDYLKPAYQIAVLARNHFFDDAVFLHTFEYYDAEHGVSLGGRSRIITLELSKADKIVDKPIQEMTASELWAVFFRYLTDKSKREKINEILENEEGIAMASEVLMTISRDEAERARLMSEFKYETDTQSKIGYARKEGRREGRKEGAKDIARNLKAMGDPAEKIARVTGLSVDQIKAL
ncbi:MAG: Rpn family recombination-promoting nuclease/putative transposase [Treponema sp.]|nr:Rpn family recombination-promoting nuclease/putative transposase [Treponema sp.]